HLAMYLVITGGIAHQATRLNIVATGIHRWDFVACCQLQELIVGKWKRSHNQRFSTTSDHGRENALIISLVSSCQEDHLPAERMRGLKHLGALRFSVSGLWNSKEGNRRRVGNQIRKKTKPLAPELRINGGNSRNIASWPV